MSISGTDRRESIKRTAVVYLLVTLLCVLFGAVYEHFSHGVYAYFMLYAFVFPLAGGALPFVGLAFYGNALPGRIACNLYHSGIAALTVGSLFQGALDIYGTTNRLMLVYWIAGALFLFLGMAAYFVDAGRKRDTDF